jgi:hypothetical protein
MLFKIGKYHKYQILIINQGNVLLLILNLKVNVQIAIFSKQSTEIESQVVLLEQCNFNIYFFPHFFYNQLKTSLDITV